MTSPDEHFEQRARELWREVAQHDRAYFAAALQVDDAPTQDAPEQRRPFRGRLAAVVPDQPQHGVLHRVHGVLAVAQLQLGHAERAAFHVGQERIQRGRNRARIAQLACGEQVGVVAAARPTHDP